MANREERGEEQVIIAGFGGQGILFAGRLLTYAAMREGKQVTWFPSYGGAMRGGTANCSVIISSEEIGSPLISHPNALVVMNTPSLDKFESVVQKNGCIVWNSSLINRRLSRIDIKAIGVPANEIAKKSGGEQAANMVMLGAYVAQSNVVSLSSLQRSLKEVLRESRYHLLPVDKKALEEGTRCGLSSLPKYSSDEGNK